MADWVDVTVKVPVDRLGEFHANHGAWLQQVENAEVEVSQAGHWSSGDKDVAKEMYAALPAKPKQLVTILANEGETDERDLIKRLGVTDSSQFNGINGWVGRIAFTVERKTPTKWKVGPDGIRTWYMDPESGALFRGLKG